MKTTICLIALLSAVSAASGETLYKVVGPDGKITYTDRPPQDDKSKSTAMQITSAPSTPLPDSVLKFQAELQKSLQNRLAAAKEMGSMGTPVLFSAVWCGYCTQA